MLHQVFNSIGSHIYNGIVYENWYFGTQFHNSFEFNYIIEGEFDATVNSVTVELKAGDCILIAPNMVHELRQKGDNKFFTAVFSSDFVHSFVKKDFSSPFYKFVLEKSTLDYLSNYMFYTGTPELYTLKSCLYAICAQAFQHSNISQNFTIDSNFILNVNKYIANNINAAFSRKDIATALKYEEHYFSTLFNNNFKMNFTKYINLFRIELACDLLLHTNDKIADIAFACGFNSIWTFNRIFKEFNGKTPNEFRIFKNSITEPDTVNQKVVIPTTREK